MKISKIDTVFYHYCSKWVLPPSCSCCSVAQLCPTLCKPMECRMPGFLVFRYLPELAQTHAHWVSDAIQTSSSSVTPLSPCPQSFPASASFPWVSSSHQVAKALECRFSISPSNEYSGIISFMIDWFDLLAFQGTLKSLFQHHSLKASVLQRSAFFMVQLSHPYVTTGKNRALTTWTFVGKVMALHFTTLSRFVSFLSKEQTSFNFMVAVTIHSNFEAWENEVCHCFHCFQIYLPWSDAAGCHDLCFLNVEF